MMTAASSPSPLDEAWIFDAVDNGMILVDTTGAIVVWNQWVEDRSVVSKSEALGRTLEELFPDMAESRIFKSVELCLHRKRSSYISNRLLEKPFPLFFKGAEKVTENLLEQVVTVKPVEDNNKRRYCLISVTDLSKVITREETLKAQARKLKHALKEVRDKSAYLQAIFEGSKDIILTFTPDGRFHSYNPAMKKVFKLDEAFDVEGCHLSDFFPELNGFTYADEDDLDRAREWFFINKGTKELTAFKTGGIEFPVEYSADEMILEDKVMFFVLMRDVTERKQAEEKLTKLAHFDSLTGLLNRAAFLQSLESGIRRAERSKKNFALLFLDLDHFKNINDTLGHDIGDLMLVEVARRLRQILRDSDVICRLGGDEFTVILEDLSDKKNVRYPVEKIVEAMAEPMLINDQELSISTSIGIAVYPDDGESSALLVRHADIAMYRAKSDGRNTFRFFTKEMAQGLTKAIQMEGELRRAIKAGEFELHYQPQLCLKTGTIVGVEALIRWRHETQGMVLPGDFIPVAEECGLIIDIGRWTIYEGCSHRAQWEEMGLTSYSLSINLSPKQFKDKNLVQNLKYALDNSGLDPGKVVLEITEGHLVDDVEAGGKILNELKKAGVQLAIDDFGTGYSSLQYLRTLPVDIVKIDRSFVINSEHDEDTARFLKGIIELVHSLGKKVVTEGVETKKQLELLVQLNCDVVQGYFVCKPLSSNLLKRWLERKPNFETLFGLSD